MNRIRKISLKEGEVVCVKLVEAKYTLAQMRNNGIMQFFDISNTNPSWPVLDLNRVSSLFYVFVSDQALSPIFLGKVLSAVVTPSAEPVPKLMLSAIFNPGNLGARLIELTKKILLPGRRGHKGSTGSAGRLGHHSWTRNVRAAHRSREIAQATTTLLRDSVNWDDAKSFIFKDIRLPSPSKKG